MTHANLLIRKNLIMSTDYFQIENVGFFTGKGKENTKKSHVYFVMKNDALFISSLV